MKYLQHINEYNKNNEYYQRLYGDEIHDYYHRNMPLEFTSSEIKALTFRYGIYNVEVSSSIKAVNGPTLINIYIKKGDITYVAAIYKFADEWFYVEYKDNDTDGFERYKCDQIGGILKLLEDKSVPYSTYYNNHLSGIK